MDYAYFQTLRAALAAENIDLMERVLNKQLETLHYLHSKSTHARILDNLTLPETTVAACWIAASLGVRTRGKTYREYVDDYRAAVLDAAADARKAGLVKADGHKRAAGGGAKLKGKMYTRQLGLDLVGGAA